MSPSKFRLPGNSHSKIFLRLRLGRRAHHAARHSLAPAQRRAKRRPVRSAQRLSAQCREHDFAVRRFAAWRRKVCDHFCGNGNGNGRRIFISPSAEPAEIPAPGTARALLALGRTRFRGVWMNNATPNIRFGDGAIGLENFRVNRDEGSGSGSFFYDDRKHELRLTNVVSHSKPSEAIMWVEPRFLGTCCALPLSSHAACDREWNRPVCGRETDSS